MRTAERGPDAGDPVRRCVLRLLHVPLLGLLLALGLAPVFLLFPLLFAEPGTDPTLRPVELWLGTALVGTVEGAARPLYRAAGLVLAVGLLSIPVLRVFLWTDLPVPHGLARWLGLDGEAALDAHPYEIWLAAWFPGLGFGLGFGLARPRAPGPAPPGATRPHRPCGRSMTAPFEDSGRGFSAMIVPP